MAKKKKRFKNVLQTLKLIELNQSFQLVLDKIGYILVVTETERRKKSTEKKLRICLFCLQNFYLRTVYFLVNRK